MAIREVLLQGAGLALRNAHPVVSGFPVGAAALVRGGNSSHRVVLGWNNESRHGDSIHAEEALVTKLRKGERFLRIVVLGENRQLLGPCGNCREVLLTRAAENAEFLVEVQPSRQRWIPLGNFLPNRWDEVVRVSSLAEGSNPLALFHAANSLLSKKPYSPYTERIQASAVVTAQGEIFSASGKEDAAYHHDHSPEIVLAMADAYRQRRIVALLFMSGWQSLSDLPFPCGRCRQKIYEAAQVRGDDIPVISARPDGRLLFSSSRNLLPFAFGPTDLGIDVSRYI